MERAILEEVLPFRRAMLRPGQPAGAPPTLGDLHPQCAHFVARVDKEIVACASTDPAPCPTGAGTSRGSAWQVRGVATRPDAQGRGHGRAVVEACFAHARAHGAHLVWCHGRVGAIPFYERLGFTAQSEEYVLPVSGPHRVMVLRGAGSFVRAA
ncbi:MAG TPA: GNAT family N-acetyltransferase [Candidatus Thermoplasmatota archaeon]|nr:GNAT family N-acetyltransferase [Candidatus Thermoplasmatota archaeon]